MKIGDDLVALLGAEADDPRVLDALNAFAIRWPPQLDDPEDPEAPDWYVWRPSSANGFEFGFQDEAHLRALDPSKRGSSPLVLSSVGFYGEHEGVNPYRGDLPLGLLLGDSRPAIRAKLSGPEVAPRVHLRDVWDAAKHRIVVEHRGGIGALESILVKLRLEPWSPLKEDPPPKHPTIDEIVAMFGQPWDSPDMGRVFFPLGLAGCGPEITARRNADLTAERGLMLQFSPTPAGGDESRIENKGALFSAAKFYRARYQDARGWVGSLPCGLEFDIAYPEIVRRVGRLPDEGRDGPLSGYALWHLSAFTLHVQYHNVDNVILSVTVFKPGT